MNNDKHYFELGKIHGRSEFRLVDFIRGLVIGLGIGILLMNL